jgi:H+/Cl- antiporter ClcA
VSHEPAPSAEAPAEPSPGGFARLLLRAAVVGLVAAAAATAYVVLEHDMTDLFWEDLPERLGYADPPWWWVVLLLVTGALLTAAALRLPGRGGHLPLDGLSFDVGPGVAVSVVPAAFATLVFGAVLGPEAPALAIGTATGALMARTGHGDDAPRPMLMLAGGAAAFGAVLGNPLVVAILLLEAALVARRTAGTPVSLAPPAIALATGYLLQVGIGPWVGLGELVLAVPTMPSYSEVLGVDLLLTLPLAIVVAAVVHAAFAGGRLVRAASSGRPQVMVLVAAALVTAGLALGARALGDIPLDQVLFSGQAALPDVVAASSAGALLLASTAKAAAYSVALGSGFRGGPVFPAVYVGAAAGTALALLVGPASVPGLATAGMAAAAAAAIRLPFSSALLAVVLASAAGLAVTSPALLAAVAGLLTALALDRRGGARLVEPGPDHT